MDITTNPGFDGLPPVTVLLPVYNGARFLSAAIQSILSQTFPNFELLIADDGSTDGTQALVGGFTDPRIRYIRFEHAGLGETLNRALRLAANDIIARMDADDIAVPERLEKQLPVYLKNPTETIVGSWYVMFSGGKIKGLVQTNTSHREIRARLALHNEIVHSGVIFHRKVILENGGYQSGAFEDFEMWLRLKDKVRFVNIAEPLTLVRVQPNSLSRGDFLNQYAIVYKLLKKYSGSFEMVMREFDIDDAVHAKLLLGWQEYFYGSKHAAQRIWKPFLTHFAVPAKVFIAYFICFLPEKFFIGFKEARWRFLLDLRRFENTDAISVLQELIDRYTKE